MKVIFLLIENDFRIYILQYSDHFISVFWCKTCFFSVLFFYYGVIWNIQGKFFLSFNKVIFLFPRFFDLKSFTLSIPSVILYSVLYMRMHDVSAIKMKQAINATRLSMFFSDNNTNTKHKAIAVTEYIIDIQMQLFAFSDIRELKVFIL